MTNTTDNVGALYKALRQNGFSDIGTEDVFRNKLQDENNRKQLYDALSRKGYNDIGDYDTFNTRIGSSYQSVSPVQIADSSYTARQANAADAGGDVPEYLQRPEEQEAIKGFIPAFKQSSDGLYQGMKSYTGENANLLFGSQRDYSKAQKQLQELLDSGYDLSGFDKDKALKDFKERQYQREVSSWEETMKQRRAEREGMGFFDALVHKFKDPDRPRDQYDSSATAFSKMKVGDEVQLGRAFEAIQMALEKSGGDVEKAYALLGEQSTKETWGDRTSREAREAMRKFKPTEGAAAWFGNMVPQIAGGAAAIAAYASPWTRGLAPALSVSNVGIQTASQAGSAMADARMYAEDAGVEVSEGDVLRAGAVSGATELGTEMLPYNRIFGSLHALAAKKLGKEVTNAIAGNPAARRELSKVLRDAGSELPSKLFTKEAGKKLIGDVSMESFSEFLAEGGGTLVPMIYQNPEDYPTLHEVLQNGWEGAKGGLFMGSILGGASSTVGHYQNRARRKQQGKVMLADTKDGVLEVVGQTGEDKYMAVDGEGMPHEITRDMVNDFQVVDFQEFDAYCRMQTEENLQKAVENGRSLAEDMDRTKKHAAKLELDKASRGLTPEMKEELDGVSPADYLASHEEIAEQVLPYLNAKAKYEGLIQGVREGIDGKIEQSDAYIDKNTHADGRIYSARLKVDDEPVSIVSGDVVVDESGLIDKERSAGRFIVVNSKGELQMRDRDDILTVDDVSDAQEMKLITAETIRQQEAQKAADEIEGKREFVEGEEVETYLNGMRVLVGVQAQNEDGTITVTDGKNEIVTTREELQRGVDLVEQMRIDEELETEHQGNASAPSDGMEDAYALNTELSFQTEDGVVRGSVTNERNADGLIEVWTEKPLNGKKVNLFTEEELNGLVQPQIETQEEAVNTQAESSNLSENQVENEILPPAGENIISPYEVPDAITEVNPAPEPIQEQKPALPVDEKGNILYHKMSVENTIADLTDGTLDDNEIDDFIAANKAEAGKLLKKVSESAPKISTNKAKYLADKKAWQEKVADAQARVDYWNSIGEEIVASRVQPGDKTAEAILSMGEPLNGEELAAMMLGTGRLPILYDSYKKETGGRNSEARGMVGLFATKANGGLSIEEAGEQLMLADQENGTHFFDENDPNAGRNAIIDVLSGARTRGDLFGFIQRNREALAERERQAELEAYEQTIARLAEASHMTPEEFIAFEENIAQMLEERLKDIPDEELKSIFAELYLDENYGRSRESDEVGTGVPEGEERAGGNEGSPGVLSEERGDNAGASEYSEKRPEVDDEIEQSGDGVLSTADAVEGREAETGNSGTGISNTFSDNKIVEIQEGNQVVEYDRLHDTQLGEMLNAIDAIQSNDAERKQKYNHRHFRINKTSDFLKSIGVKGDYFTVRTGVISRHINKDGSHGLGLKEWKDVAMSLSSPFAVTKYDKKDNAFRIWTNAKINDSYIVVGVDVKVSGKDMFVNSISTAFGLDNTGVSKDKIVWYDEKNLSPAQRSVLNGLNSQIYPEAQGLFYGNKDNEFQAEKQISQQEKRQAEREGGQFLIQTSTNDAAAALSTLPSSLSSESKDSKLSNNKQENAGFVSPSRIEGEPILDYAARVVESKRVHDAGSEVDTNPTEAQKEAGNYKKGHVKIDGFDITIENPKGSVRSGVDADGKPWSVTMNNTYGYIRGTEGVDGDHIDVFLGDSGNKVYVVDQLNTKTGAFDEHKVMYGFNSMDEATDAYLSNYSPGWQGLGAISEVSKEAFKKWIDSSHRKTKPFVDYKSVKVENGGETVVNLPESNPVASSKKSELSIEIPAMTEEEYIASEGYGFSGIGDVALHKGKQRTSKQQDKIVESQAKKDEDYAKHREILRKKYRDKLSKGELREPNIIEKLLKTANGNSDNESTQAARRTLQKRGIDWQETSIRFRETASSEEQAIIEKAKEDGTYLKAPNGKPTNLNEKQWAQVRTESFKKWFGDWENEPDTASKVIDENGEPKVVKHGTPNTFFTFSKENIGNNDPGWLGTGFYFFGNNEIYANQYAGNNGLVMDTFLNIRNPYYASYSEMEKLAEINSKESSKDFSDKLKDEGFDGVSYNGDLNDEWVAYEPIQIKSATVNVGQFSTENDDIRFRVVHHGSGASFDKFSTEFIDTGEGNQSFGWGLYFTDKKDIAQYYAETIGGMPSYVLYKDGQRANMDEQISRIIYNFDGSVKKAIASNKKTLKYLEKEGDEEFASESRKIISELEKEDPKAWKLKEEGNRYLYDVEIPDTGFLHWDKAVADEQKRQIIQQANKEGLSFSFYGDIVTPEEYFQKNQPEGFQVYKMLSEILGGDKEASMFLNRSGFNGIEYAAGRHSGNTKLPDSNFVVFDENAVRIINHLRYRLDGRRIDEVNERFNEELSRYKDGRMKSNEMFHLGTPQGAMLAFLPDLPIVMRQKTIRKGTEKKHNVDVDMLKDMPAMIASPIFVFQRDVKKMGILTEMIDRDGKNVCVAIEMNKTIQDGTNILEVNDIRSFHGREVENIIKPIRDNGTLKWVDKEKGLDWITSALHNFKQAQSDQNLSTEDFSSATKIVESFENPTIEQGKIVSEVESLADNLHTPVRIVKSTAELPEGDVARKRIENGDGIKGWFDTKSEEMAIYLPNAANVEDARESVFHEVVGHYGLRKLFGEDFNTFLDNVYMNVSPEIRKQIVVRAKERGNILDLREATEEYLAALAERGFDSVEERTLWQKIKDAFIDMLRKAGVRLGFDLTDNELRYVLWRSYQNLKGGNGILEQAQDIAFQMELGVGRFRKEDPKDVRLDLLRKSKPVEITGDEIPYSEDFKQYRKNAKQYGLSLRGEYINKDTGVIIELSKGGINEVISHDSSKERFQSVAAIPQIIENSVYIASVENEDMEKHNNILSYDYYVCGLRIGGVDYTVKAVIANSKSGERYYDHRLTQIEKGALLNQLDGITNSGEDLLTKETGKLLPEEHGITNPGPANNSPVSDFKDKRLISILQNKEDNWLLNESEPRNVAIESTKDNKENIRFRDGDSSSGEAMREYEEAVKKNLYKLQEAYQDSMLGLLKLQQSVIKETGTELADNENAYVAENHLSSKNAYEMEFYKDRFFKPMMEAVKVFIKHGRSYEEVTAYMMAKSGLERNEVFAMRDAQRKMDERMKEPERLLALDEISKEEFDSIRATAEEQRNLDYAKNRKRDYSGLSSLMADTEHYEEMAQELVDNFESGRKKAVEELWKRVNEATKNTLEKTYKSGMMTKGVYDHVKGMFEYYIPMRGWTEDVAADVYDYILSERSPFNAPVRGAQGRTSLADDPLATIGNMAESAIMQGNRNMMKQKFLNLVENHPTSLATVQKVWYENRGTKEEPVWEQSFPDIPENASADEVAVAIEEHEARMKELKENGMAKDERSGVNLKYRASKREMSEHIVVVKRGGREYAVYVNGNPRAAQAINGLTNPDTIEHKGVKLVQRVNRQLAANFTTRNPAFVVSNLSRDLIFSTTAVAIKENGKYARRFNANIAKNTLGMVKLMKRYQDGKLDMSKERDRLFKEFLENGGETGYTALHSVDEYKKLIDREVMDAKGKVDLGRVFGLKPGKVTTSTTLGIVPAFQLMSKWTEFGNRCAEDVSRFSVYMTSRQEGRSVQRSIADAKEVTVNFNKKGAGGYGATTFKSLYLFFNAGVQSSNNFYRLAKANPKRFNSALLGFTAAGVLLPMLNEFLIEMWGDDDDKDRYDDLPEWVRRNNFCFWMGGDIFVTIPLPIELRAFYGMGEIFNQWTKGNMKHKNVGYELANQVTELIPLNPLGGNGDMLATIIPDAGKPFYQVMTNKDFYGKPIYKDTDFNKLMPGFTKAYKGTSSVLVASSELLNEVTGGDKYTRGWADVNPAKVEHIFEGYFGGMGKTINQLGKTIGMIWDEDQRVMRNVPVVNRFLNETDDRNAFSRVNEEYYHYLEEFRETEQRLKGYEKEADLGIMEYAEKVNFLEYSKEYQRYEIFKDYQKELKELQTEIKEAVDKKERGFLENQLNLVKMELVERLNETEE